MFRGVIEVKCGEKGKIPRRGTGNPAGIDFYMPESVTLEAFKPQAVDMQVAADLRGNIDTRLKKLEDGQYDAIVLAAAGLKRLGKEIAESAYMPTDVCLPAIGQGAIAVS